MRVRIARRRNWAGHRFAFGDHHLELAVRRHADAQQRNRPRLDVEFHARTRARLAVVFLQAADDGSAVRDVQMVRPVMASDGFFPFPDGVEVAAKAGVTAIIAPSGSLKDADVIQRANELGVALFHAPERVFSHH